MVTRPFGPLSLQWPKAVVRTISCAMNNVLWKPSAKIREKYSKNIKFKIFINLISESLKCNLDISLKSIL